MATRQTARCGALRCWIALSLLLALIFGHAVLLAATPPRARRVLVLYSERKGIPTIDEIDRGFQSTLRARMDDAVDVYTEYLDLARFGDSRLQREQFEWFLSKYSHTHLDLIVCLGANLLAPLLHAQDPQLARVPILSVTVALRQPPTGAPNPRVTGILNPADVRGTVEAARRLQPGVERVVVVGGASGADRAFIRVVRRELEAYRGRLEATYLVGLPIVELERRLATLPPHSMVLFSTLLRDGAGQQFVGHDALSRVSRGCNAPIYGMTDTQIGYGSVGGSMYSPLLVGVRTAELAQRLLAGEKPAAIPFMRGTSTLVFDARQLRRWHLSEARLPPGAELRFREQTLWERYHWQVFTALLLFLVESALLAALLIERQIRRQAEAALRSSYQQIQELAGRLITAQETERSRIARELHDDINQQVAALAIAHSGLKRHLPPGSIDLHDEVTRLQQQAISLSGSIRHLSHELHPGVLQHAGLVAALQAYCAGFGRQQDLEVDFRSAGDLQGVPAEVTLCLYRVAQEALRNVAAHAQAHRVEVALDRTAAGVEMVIRDDGIGFGPESAERGGLGLISMDERVRLIHGSLQIVSRKEQGTELRVRVPLDPPLAPSQEPERAAPASVVRA
jgi:signal transduction histidine kinase